MKNRMLLKDIPKGKLHSAIFTTYSLNLYYLEQQVLPVLNTSGIHYVSVLADGQMLSNQLKQYGFLSQPSKRNYALHGIQSKGAFHPKIIFFAGQESILVLIGSGNLTSSGHGKNLEVWNSIYINNLEDPKFGFALQVWKYIKGLHANLGDAATNKLRSIEENCTLLNNYTDLPLSAIFNLDNQSSISFHANRNSHSLFIQLSEIVGKNEIDEITIMCPYYDVKGKFIEALNERFTPKKINVLIQKNFGALPSQMKYIPNVNFFDWAEVLSTRQKQQYFHAKNIILQGKEKNYLISGSANASVAAFGTMEFSAINEEACIIYQSTTVNYLDVLSLDVEVDPVNLKDYEFATQMEAEHPNQSTSAFVVSAEKNLGMINLLIRVFNKIENGLIHIYDEKGILQVEEAMDSDVGDYTKEITVPNDLSLMFVQVAKDEIEISNRQFIIDVNSFESNNPSPHNRSLNQLKKLIENGNFSNSKIIDYLNTIHHKKKPKNETSKSEIKDTGEKEIFEERDDYMQYLSYDEIQERIKLIDDPLLAQHYVNYKGVRLWESILAYLEEGRTKQVQAKADADENNDVHQSGITSENGLFTVKRHLSLSAFERLKKKIIKFLDNYNSLLNKKTTDTKSSAPPTLIDLAMFLIVLEMLLHLISRETIKETAHKDNLLQMSFSFSDEITSWSEYLLQFIGTFSIWCNQQSGFETIDNVDYTLKLERYKDMAFKTSLCALALYQLVNQSNRSPKLKHWLQLNLLNSKEVFTTANFSPIRMEEFMTFIPLTVIEEYGEEVVEESISNLLVDLDRLNTKEEVISKGHFYQHSEMGYVYLDKVVKNSTKTFHKLFSPGFDWHGDVHDFWNGALYCIEEGKWFASNKG